MEGEMAQLRTLTTEQDEIIGLTLDVDAGTLTAHRDGTELGTVASDLPRGESFVWYVDLSADCENAEPFSGSVTFV